MPTETDREQLVQQIENSFDNTQYPEDYRLVLNPEHYEADEIIEDFKGKHWKEITLELAYKHRLSLPLFTSQAFRFYLPGMIIASLQAPAESEQNPGEILEFIFYNLVPENNDNKEIARLSDRIS